MAFEQLQQGHLLRCRVSLVPLLNVEIWFEQVDGIVENFERAFSGFG